MGIDTYRVLTPEIGKPVTVVFDFRNSGRTPAKSISFWGLGFHGDRVPGEPDEIFAANAEKFRDSYTSKEPHPPHALASLAPGAEGHITVPDNPALTAEELSKMQAGNFRVYIYGLLTYDDGLATPGSTEFCNYVGLDKITNTIDTRPCFTWGDMR